MLTITNNKLKLHSNETVVTSLLYLRLLLHKRCAHKHPDVVAMSVRTVMAGWVAYRRWLCTHGHLRLGWIKQGFITLLKKEHNLKLINSLQMFRISAFSKWKITDTGYIHTEHKYTLIPKWPQTLAISSPLPPSVGSSIIISLTTDIYLGGRQMLITRVSH